MQRDDIKRIALGGMLAAAAVVIMCLGGFIPIATYTCPMLCCMTQFVVFWFCGKKLAWTWFAVVAVLSLLLGPDKEAAMVFIAIGYYPLLKPRFDRLKLGAVLKFLYFNIVIFAVYAVMIYLLGMQEIAAENLAFGLTGLLIILAMGNVTFFLLDKLLDIMARRLR